MGTPQFSVACLEMLIAEHYEVVGVVTQPDRPKGRGSVQTASPVKLCALANGLLVLQPGNAKELYEAAIPLSPDLAVTVAYGGILRAEFLAALPRGCINVHASLLPNYRGPSPIHQALLNGDAKTGVTTMLTDIGIDTGGILLSREMEIPPDLYFTDLHDQLSVLGAEVLKETIPPYWNGLLQPVPQDESLASRTPILKKNAGILDFGDSAQRIANQVRALNPWPGTTTQLNGKAVKILRAQAAEDDWQPPQAIAEERGNAGFCGTKLCGEIVGISKEAITVRCGIGFLCVTRIQFQNGKEMDIAACWHNLRTGWVFGSCSGGKDGSGTGNHDHGSNSGGMERKFGQ